MKAEDTPAAEATVSSSSPDTQHLSQQLQQHQQQQNNNNNNNNSLRIIIIKPLAKDVANQYLKSITHTQPHADNVRFVLQALVEAVTKYMIVECALSMAPAAAATQHSTTTTKVPSHDEAKILIHEEKKEKEPSSYTASTEAETATTETKKTLAWRDFLEIAGKPQQSQLHHPQSHSLAPVELDRHHRARMAAFLTGVALSVSKEPLPLAATQQQQKGNTGSSSDDTTTTFSRHHGLRSSNNSSSRSNSSISSYYPQIRPSVLIARLELYLRAIARVVTPNPHPHSITTSTNTNNTSTSMNFEIRMRTELLVCAYLDTMHHTACHQSTVLTKLLMAAVQEVLAVEYVSERLAKRVQATVSDYVQSISFASLAFLSSPATSADQHLTPRIYQVFQYLLLQAQSPHIPNNELVAECELERMLAVSIPPALRHTLKHIEFRSIGHLLEVCHGFRTELTNIALPPYTDMRKRRRRSDEHDEFEEEGAIRQAVRDLQREVITVNGTVLPPVTSRKGMIEMLAQVLNSRILSSELLLPSLASTTSSFSKRRASSIKSSRRRRSTRTAATSTTTITTAAHRHYESSGVSGDDTTTSDYETDLSSSNVEGDDSSPGDHIHRLALRSSSRRDSNSRRSFRLSTIDFVTKRLLLAASRTGTMGDAYFIVRDLFGGEDVEVVPSQQQHVLRLGQTLRPGSIEINVKLASVTIKCHGSFDVFPKSKVGECEPLIQLHTTTTETIALREVRAIDCANHNNHQKQNHHHYNCEDSDAYGNAIYINGNATTHYDTNDEEEEDNQRESLTLVVVERQTERTGWRYVSIRPALYEKYEEFSTPS